MVCNITKEEESKIKTILKFENHYMLNYNILDNINTNISGLKYFNTIVYAEKDSRKKDVVRGFFLNILGDNLVLGTFTDDKSGLLNDNPLSNIAELRASISNTRIKSFLADLEKGNIKAIGNNDKSFIQDNIFDRFFSGSYKSNREVYIKDDYECKYSELIIILDQILTNMENSKFRYGLISNKSPRRKIK